jgi:single-stranded DNA-binding protein
MLARFSLASKYRQKNGDSYEDKANFIDCVVWGKSAENFAKYARKGSRVCVEGAFRQSTWEKEGVKQSKVEINVSEWQLLDPKDKGANEKVVQGIAILNGPTGVRDQLGTLSAQKVVEIAPDSSRGLEWAAYPASSLDGDYKYLQMLLDRMVNLSATRSHYDASKQSGESKLWDFLMQKSVLESIATATENAVNQILSHWEAYTMAPVVEKRFALNRNYDARDLKTTLELIFQAMSLMLGETVERKLKETARDSLKSVGVNLSPDELTASNAELDAAAEAKANLDALTSDVLAMGRVTQDATLNEPKDDEGE